MKREPHISEFTTKKGSGYQVRVCTTRNGQKISRNGGRFYFSDYSSRTGCLRAARAERDRILAELDAAPVSASIGLTVGDLFERSFDVLPVAYSTQQEYRTVYNHALQDLSPVRIDRLTLQQVQLSVNQYATGHTQNRVKLLLNVWRRLYQTAFYLQIPVVDYSMMIRMPKSRVPVTTQNTETDRATFLLFLERLQESESYFAPITRDVALVMYYTGMRIQEVLGLYVADVDLGAGVLRIRRSCGSDGSGTARIVPLKTEQSRRTLPIVPELFPVLERLTAAAAGDLLFVGPDDGPVNVKNLSMLTHNVCRRYGLKFTLYSLRHLFSADLFRQGVNPKVVQSLMGHASANMSAYYAFTTEDERADAVLKRKPS